MRILFCYLAPGKVGSVSSFVKMLEGYCNRFPNDDLTVMCAAGSLFETLGRFPNCHVEVVGKKIPRELYLLGAGDLAVRRLHRARHFDVYWAINVGLYFESSLPQVLTMNNAHQVYPRSARIPHPMSNVRVSLLRLLFRRSLRLSKAAIVQTPLMKSYLQKTPGCPSRVAVVPKAVVSELDTSARSLSGEIAEKLKGMGDVAKLLFISTGIPHKNHKILAEMMQQFKLKGRRIGLVVTITPDRWRELVGPEGGGLIDSGHVVPLGWVDKEEMGPLYRACDLSVMPSLLESLSSANIEAMYWKKPQIVADLPYAHDLCGDSALYVSPHDSSAWCSQVERLSADSPLREELVARGTLRLADFPESWEAMAERIREVLAAVCAERIC